MATEIERTGVVRGKRVIELDEEIPLPDGAPVRLRLVSGEPGDPAADAETDATLRDIYQMRHQGRSIQKP